MEVEASGQERERSQQQSPSQNAQQVVVSCYVVDMNMMRYDVTVIEKMSVLCCVSSRENPIQKKHHINQSKSAQFAAA